MRLPNAAHDVHHWAITQLVPDFTLLDVWSLPADGGADDFASFLEIMASLDPAHAASTASRALFALRFRVGRWLGWDDVTQQRPVPGCTETTLRARLPERLRDSATRPAISVAMQRSAGGFIPLYRTHDEWAAEISNGTVHGVLHVAWVEQGADRYRPQMGVYVKPRGRLGKAYLMLIGPFRHLIVYPALMRHIGRAWEARDRTRPGAVRDPQR